MHSKLWLAGVFDLLTKTYMRSTKKDKPGVDVAVAAGITSACLAQVLSFPLETVARRLQVGQPCISVSLTSLLPVYKFCMSLSTIPVPHAKYVSASAMLCCAVLYCTVL